MKIKLNIWLLLGVLLMAAAFSGCDDDDEELNNDPIVVNSVFLQDAESTVPDRPVDFIRLGQVLRLEGSGFTGIRRVFVNGYNTYFNPVYVTDNSMLLQVSRDTPTSEAEEDVRNTIRLVKTGTEKVIPLEIRAAAPSVSRISHTMPLPGESITIYGSGLVEIEKVVFPGDVEVTEGIESDEDGKFVTVTVPDGVSDEGGSLFVLGANGGAYSPAYFNFKGGVILDFDGRGQQGFWSWSETGTMINAEDLESEVIGTGNVSQGNYVAHRPARLESFNPAANRRSEVWTAGNDVDDWRGQLTPYIPATTPVNQVAFQFDVYVPEPWGGTGFLKILLMNNYNGGEWTGFVYNYLPWIVNKEVVPFETTGWTTVTVPFSQFYGFSSTETDFTFEDVLAAREAATYKNFGFFFENSDVTLSNVSGNAADSEVVIESAVFDKNVYTDNWRIVSLERPVYSDFPEEEAAAE
ncbi:glycan-binding surface protein [Geofilum rubicundum]|uniref:Surface glycan-binding protein B xyloglucan binding domain-containing protein n=1 Tax=Geofilum rubicundum JCM 15548 TaxID=1236989 RepID=A0A0E9M160_9BACT|nr:glycan-binding surface protein [Geofilum rubicundum]GAO30860.1 hypothetical protein JCM15548_13175 [Geofilum rubicundum JCM 15548]